MKGNWLDLGAVVLSLCVIGCGQDKDSMPQKVRVPRTAANFPSMNKARTPTALVNGLPSIHSGVVAPPVKSLLPFVPSHVLDAAPEAFTVDMRKAVLNGTSSDWLVVADNVTRLVLRHAQCTSCQMTFVSLPTVPGPDLMSLMLIEFVSPKSRQLMAYDVDSVSGECKLSPALMALRPNKFLSENDAMGNEDAGFSRIEYSLGEGDLPLVHAKMLPAPGQPLAVRAYVEAWDGDEFLVLER